MRKRDRGTNISLSVHFVHCVAERSIRVILSLTCVERSISSEDFSLPEPASVLRKAPTGASDIVSQVISFFLSFLFYRSFWDLTQFVSSSLPVPLTNGVPLYIVCPFCESVVSYFVFSGSGSRVITRLMVRTLLWTLSPSLTHCFALITFIHSLFCVLVLVYILFVCWPPTTRRACMSVCLYVICACVCCQLQSGCGTS